MELSVVLATWNRPAPLARLLSQLAAQTLTGFEVIVVDDGSRDAPVVDPAAYPFQFQLLRQENAGAAAARHNGILHSKGRVIVITDDDMQVAPRFLEAHLRRHGEGARTAVLGEIRPDPSLAQMPLFERFHADSLARQAAARERDAAPLHGNALCTGNVSFLRADYDAVGGFDRTLERSEDADLGLRFEQAGVRLVFDRDAYVIHSSDHTSLDTWLARAYRYGRHDQRIADKYPQLPWANPWRCFFEHALAKRPALGLAAAVPVLADPAARALMAVGNAAAAAGLEKAAVRAAGLAFDLEYVRGLRESAGSLRGAVRRMREFRALARRTV